MSSTTVICHDSPTRDTCPTLHRSDDGEYYVQGYVVTDPNVLAGMDIPDSETVVKITPRLVRLIAQAVSVGKAGELTLSDDDPVTAPA